MGILEHLFLLLPMSYLCCTFEARGLSLSSLQTRPEAGCADNTLVRGPADTIICFYYGHQVDAAAGGRDDRLPHRLGRLLEWVSIHMQAGI